MSFLKPLFIVIPLFAISLSVNSEIYKWTDEHGRTHYGDKPKDKLAEEIEYKTKESVLDKQKPESWKEIQQRQDKYLNYLEEERQIREGQREGKRDKLAQQKKQCNETKTRLDKLNNTPIFYREDENGNREFLSDEEKDEKVKQAKEYIEKYC